MAEQAWIKEADSQIGIGLKITIDSKRIEEFKNTDKYYFVAMSWQMRVRPFGSLLAILMKPVKGGTSTEVASFEPNKWESVRVLF